MIDPDAPDTAEDIDPTVEGKSSRLWLGLIKGAEEAFGDYQHRADNIDKLYSDLKHLAANARDRQFQLFWANIQVLSPSIYSRPPVPVVVPKFKDRRPLYRVASELLERSSVVAFDLAGINDVMMLIRDDLTIQARGVAWVRYETKAESDGPTERVCVEHKDRKDFLHEPARNWSEVGWVAGAGYLTKREMRKRFSKSSGKAYQDAEYCVRKEDKQNGAADNRAKAKVWEIWSKDEKKVVWVTEGVDKVLDEGEPHLKLEGFFPCPKPAYGTLQRRSLVPVPDVVFYRDQLEEVNMLTARIHALADALKVRGFYPAGASEIGDAVESAIKMNDDRQLLVPISNWAAFGTSNGEPIIWLPIDQIATVVSELVELRKQVINDVYEIVGLSDIMRGSTEASETATAQNLKSQYGSVRIRDKQAELVRIARDLVRISAEIMAENFSKETLLEMCQMEIPSDADIAKQIEGIKAKAQADFQQQLQQAQQNPELMQQAQQNPQQAQQVIEQAQQQIEGQAQQQIDKLKQTPTIEQVMQFLHDQKIRPFVLDIETDSTIQPDEDAEKQRRTEFMGALGTTLQELGALVTAQPAAAPFAAEVLKFAMAPFRAGRELEQSIEEFADQMAAQAGQPKPDTEAQKAQQEAEQAQQKHQMEMQAQEAEQKRKDAETAANQQREDAKLQADLAIKQAENERGAIEHAKRLSNLEVERIEKAQQHQQTMEKGALDLALTSTKIEQARVQTENSIRSTESSIKATADKTDIAAAKNKELA